MKNEVRPDERAVSWKVLLPISRDSRVLALDMNEGEISGLSRTFRQVDTLPDGSKYDVLVFGKLKSESQSVDMYLSQLTSKGVVVAVGSSKIRDKLCQSRWQCVAEYSCLPSSQPRIFLPIVSTRVRNCGLDFHSPGSLQGKVRIWCAKGLSFFGITAHLRYKTVAFFTTDRQIHGDGSLKDWISQRIGWTVKEMVIYAGSESHARKITALGLSSDCLKKIVVRIADSDLGNAAIKRESAALHVLSETPLADSVPLLVAEGEYGPYSIQLQSCLPKARGQCRSLSDAHLEFLSALSRINRVNVSIYKTVEWDIVRQASVTSYDGTLPEPIKYVASGLLNIGIGENTVECHMTHGDFVPWNIIRRNDSIYVYDWEDFSLVGFPFFDVFHFIYRQASLIGPWPGARGVLKVMRDKATRLARSAGIGCRIEIALAMWAIKEYSCNPSHRLDEIARELTKVNHG